MLSILEEGLFFPMSPLSLACTQNGTGVCWLDGQRLLGCQHEVAFAQGVLSNSEEGSMSHHTLT